MTSTKTWAYKGRDTTGKVVKGKLDAASQAAVAFQIDVVIEDEAGARQLRDARAKTRGALTQHFVCTNWPELVVEIGHTLSQRQINRR